MTQLWDPLWEYVLEDYDHEEETKPKRRSRSSRNSSSSNRSGKDMRSSSSRNVQFENKNDNRFKEEESSNLFNMSMSSWSFFDMSGDDNHNDAGDQRDDASDHLDWDDAWLNGRDVKEVEQSPAKRKGILRRNDSKSSTESRKNSSSRMLSKQGSGRMSFSRNKSIGSNQEFDDYGAADTKTKRSASIAASKNKERRSSLRRSPPESDQRLSPRQSKSETSTRSQEKIEEKRVHEDESAGFTEMWDMLTGKPPVSVARSQPSTSTTTLHESSDEDEPQIAKSTGGRNRIFPLSLRKSNSEGSGIGLRDKQPRDKTVVKGTSYSKVKEQKRSRLFKRRTKQNLNCKSSSREITVRKPSDMIQEVGLNDAKVEEADRGNKNDNSNQSSFATFDPLMMLFEVAGRLDPWAAESSVGDTNSETTASETTVINDETSDVSHSDVSKTTRCNVDTMASLLDQPLPDPNSFDPRYAYHPQEPRLPGASYSTEIRLKVNTVGDTVSERVYKRTPSFVDEESEHDTENSELWGSIQDAPHATLESTPGVRISVVDSARYSGFYDASTPPENAAELEQLSFALESTHLKLKAAGKAKSLERREIPVPVDLRIQKEDNTEEEFDDVDEEGFPSTNHHGIWKAVCCSVGKKKHKNDLINRLRKEDVAEVFPTTRMISSGQTCFITGEKADHVNGVMGVPSDHFVNMEGPHSLYAYDYGSNEHMDVCFTEMNKKPRSSISVRDLGGPPSLSGAFDQDSIVVQIEASTISETDCLIRQGKWWHENDKPPQPTTPGVDMVGKVLHIKKSTESEYDLHPSQTVLSLIRWGGNSRYKIIHPKQLVKVPDGLDPAEVACLPETYLTGFQCLHMGQSGSRRYHESSLKGKSVLIIGCMSNNIGKAIIELALNAGVANIYATCKKKHWKTLISYGVLPLSPEPMEWIHRIEGTIDLVLAPNGNIREDVTPVHFQALLPKQGQLILCGHRSVGHDIPINDWKKDQSAFSCGKNKALTNILNKSYAYDVYKAWETNLDLCKKDLAHLLTLMEQEVIKPKVLDRLPLNKVAKAQDLLESKRLPGFLVCEPWMRSKKRAVYL